MVQNIQKDSCVWKRASEMLKNGEVLGRITELKQKRSQKLDISENRILAEIASIAFSDVGELVDDHGNFKGLKNLPAATRRAVKSVRLKRYIEGTGDNAREVEIIQVDMHSKLPALEKICDIKGITSPKTEERNVMVTINVTGNADVQP